MEAFTFYDFFFCLTGKFITENNIMEYDSYNILIFTIILIAAITSLFFIKSNDVYGQIAFFGAFIFIKVKFIFKKLHKRKEN